MNTILLRSGFIIFLLFFFLIGLRAQQNRFIYLQTENKQPFYVKMDKKILSSSISGHIIVSKLTDSIYKIYFGFPKNEWPEQNVTISVKAADAGFVLKNLGEKGWGLLNLQTMQVLMADMDNKDKRTIETDTAGDEFAKVLAAVVNDPSIVRVAKYKNEITPVDKKTDNKIEVAKAESEIVKPVISNQNKADAVSAKVEISKLPLDSTAGGIKMSYLDMVNGNTDTVNIFFPVNNPEMNIVTVKHNEKQNPAGVIDEKKNTGLTFIDIELPNPNQLMDSAFTKTTDIVINEKKKDAKKITESGQDSTSKNSNAGRIMINSDCKKSATDKDFLKLRKQMAAEGGEYNLMIKVANKQFIITCFTTEQIKNLGVLFIKEEERYKFFVAAFPFVADTHNYSTLQDQLTDNYYKVRFKAMVSH